MSASVVLRWYNVSFRTIISLDNSWGLNSFVLLLPEFMYPLRVVFLWKAVEHAIENNKKYYERTICTEIVHFCLYDNIYSCIVRTYSLTRICQRKREMTGSHFIHLTAPPPFSLPPLYPVPNPFIINCLVK